MISELTGVESAYEIPDVLWDRISSLLPLRKRKKKAGRPRMNDRKTRVLFSMFYVPAASGMLFQESLGASSTVHDRFQEWRSAGVFRRMWIDGLSVYDKKTGIDWKWQAMDGVITKAPLGGKRYWCKSYRQSQMWY